MTKSRVLLAGLVLCCIAAAAPAVTNNILLTGYWPPTNNIVRPFSTNIDQNPGGWIGGNWEGLGYDVHSFFPEFDDFPNDQVGSGDLTVDYQDTSEDFWRIVDEIQPVAIITMSRGNNDNSWELERKQRNLTNWLPDFIAPFQPTPSPPDPTWPADAFRLSTLPDLEIATALIQSDLDINAMVDFFGFGGGFLSEFIAYHGVWYQTMHSDPSDPAWSVAAGHIHVGGQVSLETGQAALDITLRELIEHVDDIVPEPSTALLLGLGALLATRRRRTHLKADSVL